MERATILLRSLSTALILLVLYPKPEVQTNWLQHRRPLRPAPANIVDPLCVPQYSLVNRACSSLTYPWVPAEPSPPSLEGLDSRLQWAPYVQNKTAPTQEDCCHWLKEIDDFCVCDLLVNLPPFLAKPVHNYTVVVDDSCSVTFQCGTTT